MSTRGSSHVRRWPRRVAAVAVVALGLAAQHSPAVAEPVTTTTGVLVEFDGATLDLSQDWGGAAACTFDGVTARCFASEAEMDRSLTTVTRPTRTLSTAAVSCSSSLRLYDGTYLTGTVLLITARQTPIDLSLVGFDNITSSYRVGACSSNLYKGFLSYLYPGDTFAYAGANVMLTGWNNTISSVYVL